MNPRRILEQQIEEFKASCLRDGELLEDICDSLESIVDVSIEMWLSKDEIDLKH